MSTEKFLETIADDLFEFIMSHDVKEDDLEDYLLDILDLMMVEEELLGGSNNPASIAYMAHYTMEVMKELQEGKNSKVQAF